MDGHFINTDSGYRQAIELLLLSNLEGNLCMYVEKHRKYVSVLKTEEQQGYKPVYRKKAHNFMHLED